MARDPAILAHQEWLGYVQPVGLVVSIPAMLDANVRVNQNFAPDHRNFLEALPAGSDGEPIPEVSDFPEFAESVLGWSRSDLYGAPGASALPTISRSSAPRLQRNTAAHVCTSRVCACRECAASGSS